MLAWMSLFGVAEFYLTRSMHFYILFVHRSADGQIGHVSKKKFHRPFQNLRLPFTRLLPSRSIGHTCEAANHGALPVSRVDSLTDRRLPRCCSAPFPSAADPRRPRRPPPSPRSWSVPDATDPRHSAAVMPPPSPHRTHPRSTTALVRSAINEEEEPSCPVCRPLRSLLLWR